MKILKEGSIYVGASIIQKIIPFALMPFLTRILSTEEYGMVAIFFVLVSLYSLFIGTGLNGFVRVIYHKSTSQEFIGYMGNSLIFFITLSLVAYTTTWLFESTLSQLFGLEKSYLYLALFTAFSKFIFDMRLVIFQTMRQAFNFAKLQLTFPIIEVLLVIFLVFYLYKGAEGRILAMAISALMAGIFSTYLMHKAKLLCISFNLKFFKRIARFIFPLLPHSIALTAFFTVDKLILSSNIGLSIVGEFAVALSLALPIWTLTESINAAFMPWSFEKFREGRLNEVVGVSYLLLIGLFIVGVLYSILLFFTFDMITGEAFKNVLYPALILIWVGWFKLAYYLFAKAIVYSEDMNYLPIISISSGCLYLGLIYANIENITLVNVSLYMNTIYIVMSVGGFILSKIKFPQPWGNFGSIIEVLKIVNKYIRSQK
ncbi:oligosaccharide flippase family protein [bacterium]|nr:oligosaccharide flippase family protein [bacterium]